MATTSHEKKRKRSQVADVLDDRPATADGTARAPEVHQKNSSISNLFNGMDIDSSQDLSKGLREPRIRTSPVDKKRSKKGKSKQNNDLRRGSLMSVASVEETQLEEQESQLSHGRQKRQRNTSPVAAIHLKPIPSPPKLPEVPNNRVESSKPRPLLYSKDIPAVQMERLDMDLTPMQKAMRDKLQGSAFRKYNELIYKSDSKTFIKLVKENPQMYDEYHAGFRNQVTSWPTNPVEHFISVLRKYSKTTFIVDLGCGDAALAKALISDGFKVLSFDVVPDGDFVVEADICDRLPLPGTERGGGNIVDVVVFSLSLMSTNWPQSIREARRVLKVNGELKIAEVTSRLKSHDDFVDVVCCMGFQLVEKVNKGTHFTLYDFKVSAPPATPWNAKEWKAILSRGRTALKPCEYKRR